MCKLDFLCNMFFGMKIVSIFCARSIIRQREIAMPEAQPILMRNNHHRGDPKQRRQDRVDDDHFFECWFAGAAAPTADRIGLRFRPCAQRQHSEKQSPPNQDIDDHAQDWRRHGVLHPQQVDIHQRAFLGEPSQCPAQSRFCGVFQRFIVAAAE